MKKKYAPAPALLLTLALGLSGCVPSDGADKPATAAPVSPPAVTATAPAPAPTAGPASTAVQIASALDRAAVQPSYDLSSPDSVYVPDLGACTGHRLWLKSVQDYGSSCYRSYQIPEDMDREELYAVLAEYVELLDGLANFQTELPFGRSPLYDGTYGEGIVLYTGSGSVEDNAWTLGGDVRGVELRVNDGWDHVMLHYGSGLKFADAGARLSGVDAPADKAAGPRFADAYCLDGGVYYNAGDQVLSVKAGECAVLMNGTLYAGSAAYPRKSGGSRDEFGFTGFYRDWFVQIALPKDRPMAGDIYTIDDFLRAGEDGAWNDTEYAFGVGYGGSTGSGNGEYAMPYASVGGNDLTAVTVRVLSWDKSGDTVLYFYAEGVVDGEAVQVEGLAAANWAEPEKPASSGSSGDKECPACGGSGRCRTCGGSGEVSKPLIGTGRWENVRCTSCGGSGSCRDCGGDGRK